MPTTTATKRIERAPTSSAVTPDQAQANVRRLFDIELQQSSELDRLRSEFAALETQSGAQIVDAIIEGDGQIAARSLVAKVAEARASIEMCVRTIDAARRQRAAAIKIVLAADAAAKRAEAETLIAEAARLERRDRELRDEIEKLQGVRVHTDDELLRRFPLPMGMIPGSEIRIKIARSQALRDRAKTLLDGAAALERREVQTAGSARGGSVDELITQVTTDPMRIAPTVDSVRQWAAQGVAAIEVRRQRMAAHETGYRGQLDLMLQWQDAAIVTSASSVHWIAAE